MKRLMAPVLFIAMLALQPSPSLAQHLDLRRITDTAKVVLMEERTFQMGLDDQGVAWMIEVCRSTGGTLCRPEDFDRERGDQVVTVTRFFLDSDEVDRDQYYRCIEQGACAPVDERACSLPEGEGWSTGQPIELYDGSEHTPVTCVTLAEAQAYCRWVGARLPTETEWAFAAVLS